MAQRKFLVPITVGIAVLGVTSWVWAELPEMRIVAATDVPLPDGTDATPQIVRTSIDGDTAFLAEGLEGAVSLVQEFDKVPEIVIRLGDPAPSGDGTVTGLGAFHMTPARLLFKAETSAGQSLLLTYDGTTIRSAFQEWYPDVSLQYFDIEASNEVGDALLRVQSSTGGTIGFVRVPNGPDGVGDTIEIVSEGDPVPGASGFTFSLPEPSIPAYMADDGQVVFKSVYADATNSGLGVFVMRPGSSTLEQVTVPFPGTLTDTEICCDLLDADRTGVVGLVGSRDGEEYLFVGKPFSTSLALTVPVDGLPIPNAPGYLLTTLTIDALSIAAGRGGEFVWISQVEDDAGAGYKWAVLSYVPGTGLRLLAMEGEPAPGGGMFNANFSSPIANGKGGFQFISASSVFRASLYDGSVTLERVAGPGDSFAAADGTMVTAQQVDSQLDSRAFEAGRVGFTVYYTDTATNTYEWMTLVDGTPPPPPKKSGGCQVSEAPPHVGLLGAFGLLLLGMARRRKR